MTTKENQKRELAVEQYESRVAALLAKIDSFKNHVEDLPHSDSLDIAAVYGMTEVVRSLNSMIDDAITTIEGIKK